MKKQKEINIKTVSSKTPKDIDYVYAYRSAGIFGEID